MTSNIEQLVKEKSGIRLDIGGGGNPNPGFVNMDARALDGVDIVWDVTKFPWPLEDETVLCATASHLLEHIPPFQADPKLLGLIELLVDSGLVKPEDVAKYIGRYDSTPMFIAFMNEVWRVLKVGGEFAVSVPHGRSDGFLQDPSHCNAINEARWAYFDPEHPSRLFYIYQPKPFRLKWMAFDPSANMEVVMVKRAMNEVANVDK